MSDQPTTGGPRGPEFTVIGPEPAIDPREVARLAREIRVRFLATEESYFPETPAEASLYWSNAARQAEWILSAERAYLASHGIPSAEDPRDAEIRKLYDALSRMTNERFFCRQQALAAESKPVEAPKPAELTREQRLVRFALDARALGSFPCVSEYVNDGSLSDFYGGIISVNQAEAAAVRAALEEA